MSMIGNIGGQSGGGILTKSILIVTAPTGSTVTVTKGSVTKAAAEKNGEWWFRNLDNGEWTITATKNTQKATATYSIAQFGVYRKSITYFQATIHVTYPAGSTCTATDGATTLRAPDTSGNWACVVPNAGNWTITSTLGGQSDRKVVSISSDGQTASVVLAYFRATINVTYPVGSTCTATDGKTTLQAPDTSGSWACVVPNAGNWTITVPGKVYTEQITIDRNEQVEYADVSCTVIFRNGKDKASITGGWDCTKLPGYGSGVQLANDGNRLKVSCTGTTSVSGVAHTVKKVDLTSYATLEVDVDVQTIFGITMLAVYPVISEWDDYVANTRVETGGKIKIDVKSLTGSYYIGLWGTNDTYSMKESVVYMNNICLL